MRKKESRLKSLEDSIAKAEARLAGLDMELIKPEVYTDYIESGRLMEEKKDTEAWLEGMYSEWERLSAEPWD
jgi:ATP-binding cassette subfamily F protein 3